MADIKFYWFDMDHTLVNNDCDVSWKEFAVKYGLAPQEDIAIGEKFFEDYNNGCLDADAFTKFQLAEFVGKTYAEMEQLMCNHFVECVLPKVYLPAKALFEELQAEDKKIGILTATNTVIAKPVADYFKADLLLGTQLAMKDGRFTGDILQPYAGGEGKVEILQEFANAVKIPMSSMAYYGDSINDRFVLEAVGYPHATNPSAELKAYAEERNWQIVDFRNEQ